MKLGKGPFRSPEDGGTFCSKLTKKGGVEIKSSLILSPKAKTLQTYVIGVFHT